jgi:hypothetical protein
VAKIKAWWVNIRGEEGGMVVYAERRNQARMIGLGVLDADEYIDVEATLFPARDRIGDIVYCTECGAMLEVRDNGAFCGECNGCANYVEEGDGWY